MLPLAEVAPRITVINIFYRSFIISCIYLHLPFSFTMNHQNGLKRVTIDITTIIRRLFLFLVLLNIFEDIVKRVTIDNHYGEIDDVCCCTYSHPKRFLATLHVKVYSTPFRIWYSSFSLLVHFTVVSSKLSSYSWSHAFYSTPQTDLCIRPHFQNELLLMTTMSLTLLPHATSEISLTPYLCSWSCMPTTFWSN